MVDSRKKKGQFFTPTIIARALIERSISYFSNNFLTIDILDPSVGEGVFCYELFPFLKKKGHEGNVLGYEIDDDVLQNAESVTKPLIKGTNHNLRYLNRNFLTDTYLYNEKKKFDLIIGNPPYNASYTTKEWIEIKKAVIFESNDQFPKESSFFFVLKCLKLLKPKGILAFILPKPFVSSNKWKIFREICFKQYRILEIFDLMNQFSGQLQEQIILIIQNEPPSQSYQTGSWENNNLTIKSEISQPLAVSVDNFLINVYKNEQNLIKEILKRCKRISWEAFRGLNSQYRSTTVGEPLIEKSTIVTGFLLPNRHTTNLDNSSILIQRIRRPKLVAQRIITYQTKPRYKLTIPVIVDPLGSIITHETAINIIPSLSDSTELYSFGAILQSTFSSWWFQHVVYTKTFVTSKDLDKPYINKFVLPNIGGKINKSFRSRIQGKIDLDYVYSEFMDIIRHQSKIDMFFSLGILFQMLLSYGKQIKDSLDYFLPQDKKMNLIPDPNRYKMIKKLNTLFSNGNMRKITSLLQEENIVLEKAILTKTLNFYKIIAKLRLLIDEVVYLLYNLSPNERKIIENSK